LNDSLQVELRPSRMLATAVALGHLAALAAAVTGLPAPAAALVAGGLALSAAYHLRVATHRSSRAVAGLAFRADGSLAVAGPTGAWLQAELRHCAAPTGWLAVLSARDQAGRSRTAVILPDAIDPETFRRLRAWLRWRTAPSTPGSGGVDHAAG
jgi:toxin CptA